MRVIRLDNCNFNCNFCFLSGKNNIKNNLVGAKKILLTGGEPFCNPEVFSILETCLSENIQVEIQTNASVFYKKENVDLLRKYKSIIVDIMIGFHSHDEKIFKKITSTDYFSKVVDGIRNLSESEMPICLHCTMMKLNYMNVLDYIKFVEKNFPRIKRIRLSLVSPCGRALDNFKSVVPKISETVGVVVKSLKYCNKNEMKLIFPSCGVPGYPLCFLLKYFSEKELNEHCEARIQKSTEGFEFEGVKFDKCKKCNFNNICCGIPKRYVMQYGEGEFD